VFLYLQNQIFYSVHAEILEKGGMTKRIYSPFFGEHKVFSPCTDEYIEYIKNDLRYKISKEINDKLGPIVDLIKDGDPKLFEEVSNCFKSNDDDYKEEKMRGL